MKIVLGQVHKGPAGSATEQLVTLDADDPPDWVAGISHWFIDAPRQSPAWRHYLLTGIHLRPVAGVKPANLRRPGMTHEIMLVAIDPSKNPDPLDPDSWEFLRPFNLVEQLKLRNDALLARLLNLAAKAVVQGSLWAEPLLSGQVEPWRTWLRVQSLRIAGEVQ